MSLLGVLEFSAFPLVLSSSTTQPIPLTGIRLNPCGTPFWCRPSGHLADPTPDSFFRYFRARLHTLWFQGTRMCPLWMGKAGPRRWSNHRGFQVSKVIPSILLAVVKTRAETKLHSSSPTLSVTDKMEAQRSPFILPAALCSTQPVEDTTRVCFLRTLEKPTIWS